MLPSKWFVFSPSGVFTVSVGTKERIVQSELIAVFFIIVIILINNKTYFPNSSNDTQWRTWSVILSTGWPHSSLSVSRLEVHCLDLKQATTHHSAIGEQTHLQWIFDRGCTLLGHKLWGHTHFEWAENRWVVTGHDVISASYMLKDRSNRCTLLNNIEFKT